MLPFEESKNGKPAKNIQVDLKGNEKIIYDFISSAKDAFHIDAISNRRA
jgi:hypothetical protein